MRLVEKSSVAQAESLPEIHRRAADQASSKKPVTSPYTLMPISRTSPPTRSLYSRNTALPAFPVARPIPNHPHVPAPNVTPTP